MYNAPKGESAQVLTSRFVHSLITSLIAICETNGLCEIYFLKVFGAKISEFVFFALENIFLKIKNLTFQNFRAKNFQKIYFTVAISFTNCNNLF